ncbi:MAG TPA: OmpH family outer membrane protein [Polyangiaceae bacterium]|jgi:outer membrane protein
MKFRFAPLLAATLFAAVPAYADQPQAGVRVAVVDVQRAMMQTEDGLRVQATLKKEFDKKQQELNKKQTDLQKQKEDIDKQAKVLSKDAYSRKLEELQKQMMELQTMFVDYNKQIDKEQKEKTEPIFEKIMAIVKRIATTENYDIVVDKTTVAYVRTDLDLTDKCIQMYNSGQIPPVTPAPTGSGGGLPRP